MTENYINLFERLSNTENDNFIEIVPLLGEVASTLIINCLFDEFGKILMNLDVSKLNILKDNEKFLRAMIAFYYEKKMYRQVFEMLAVSRITQLHFSYVGFLRCEKDLKILWKWYFYLYTLRGSLVKFSVD